MSQDPSRLRQPPGIDTEDLLQRKQAEVELFSVEARLRAVGWQPGSADDASRLYRQLRDRRAELISALASMRAPQEGPGGPADPRLPAALRGPLLGRPIAPAVFDPVSGVYRHGSAGVVQPAPFSLGTSVVPTQSSTGKIRSVPGTDPGSVAFNGLLTAGGEPVSFVWLQAWQVLVPFPPPPVQSLFTYSFGVQAVDNLFTNGGGELMSFVSLGETPDLLTGEEVPISIDAGFPIAADLAQPTGLYNGSYGTLHGQITVERSFLVQPGQVPGVAIVIGAAAALDAGTQLDLTFPGLGDCGIAITSDSSASLIAYAYEPRLVIAP
jgi:hypothetical protein